jgi:hypothetical protein
MLELNSPRRESISDNGGDISDFSVQFALGYLLCCKVYRSPRSQPGVWIVHTATKSRSRLCMALQYLCNDNFSELVVFPKRCDDGIGC